jgi:hypothetical protein
VTPTNAIMLSRTILCSTNWVGPAQFLVPNPSGFTPPDMLARLGGGSPDWAGAPRILALGPYVCSSVGECMSTSITSLIADRLGRLGGAVGAMIRVHASRECGV